ncbi:MAG: LLM class flavin-dependent oxidoreductase [Candidatus Baldrarchaeia archaeon]
MRSEPMKFGMVLSPPMPPVNKVMEIAKMTEDAGFDSIVVPDHLLMVPPGFTPNAFGILAALAVKTIRVTIGTGVSDVIRYHPAVLAQLAATIDHLSSGRMFLGLGAGEIMNLTPFGLPFEKPFSRLKEAIYLLRRLWRGERFSYDGKFFKFNNAFLQITPVRGSIPIYVGANSVKSREFTGECCEGWMPMIETPETYKKHLEDVKRGLERSGRSLDDIDTAIQIYTAVSHDRNEAIARIRAYKGIVVAMYGKVQEAGFEIKLPEKISPLYYSTDLLVTQEKLTEFARLASYVPDDVAMEFFIVGTPEDCIDQIERFRKAGLKHLIIINVGPRPKEVLKIYSEKIIPAFKD